MSSGTDQRPLLGEVLVQHGVLTPEQLASALEEQQRTGRPIGEVIVERGYVPGPIVAQALATQFGGLVKSEYGFATGFQTAQAPAPVVPQASGDPRDETIAELRRTLASREAEIERLQDMIGQLRSQCVDAAKAKTRLAEAEAELARLRVTAA